MTTVKLPGVDTNDSQMVIHTSISNTDISLARLFQKHLSYPTREHDLVGHRKYSKRFSKRKWTEREYHFQDIKYVQQTSVKNHVLQRSSNRCHFVVHMQNPI